MEIVCLAGSILLGTVGHLVTKTGVSRAGLDITTLFEPLVIGGIFCYFLSFILFLPWLHSRPAGVAVPAAGLTYALVAVGGWFIRGEMLSIPQLIGLIAVGWGVWMLTG